MKKIVFAIQVFVLSAMFPVYLVAELNHGTGRSPVNNSTSAFTERLKENNIRPALDPKDKMLPSLMFKMNIPDFSPGVEVK